MPKDSNTTEVFDPRVLARSPYRGIIKEIAIEMGVNTSCIWFKVNRLNPHLPTLERVKQKMRDRDQDYKDKISAIDEENAAKRKVKMAGAAA